MSFRKVSPGTPVKQSPARSSAWLNAVTDAAKYYQEQIALGHAGATETASAAVPKIRNMTEADLLRGHAVELGDYLLDPLDHRKLWFEGDLYAGGQLAVVREATPDGKIGRVQLVGETTVLVDVTDTGHTHATPANGEVVFESGTSGPVLLLQQPGSTGVQELPGLLGVVPQKYELLRGIVTHVDPVLNVVTLSATPAQLPSGAKALPTGTLKAFNRHAISVSVSDEVYCVHDTACYDDTGTTNTHGVLDWSVLPFEGLDTTKTLLFKLYNNVKHRNDSSFEAKLCKADKTVFGDPVTIYDPFAGTSKGFSAGHHEDAVGRCTMERDAETGDTRLVVTHLESIAQYVVGELGEDWGYTNSGEAKCSDYSAWGPDLQYLEPTEEIVIFGDESLHGHLKAGDRFTAVLYDPDADDGGDPAEPRTAYLIVDHPGQGGTSLIAKLTTTVSAKDGDEFGTGTAHLGHPVDGDWTLLEEDVEVLNPSNLPINLPSGKSIHLPVDLINGEWVLSAPLELLSLAGWMEGIDQSIGHDADELPEWQADGDCDEEEEE